MTYPYEDCCPNRPGAGDDYGPCDDGWCCIHECFHDQVDSDDHGGGGKWDPPRREFRSVRFAGGPFGGRYVDVPLKEDGDVPAVFYPDERLGRGVYIRVLVALPYRASGPIEQMYAWHPDGAGSGLEGFQPVVREAVVLSGEHRGATVRVRG